MLKTLFRLVHVATANIDQTKPLVAMSNDHFHALHETIVCTNAPVLLLVDISSVNLLSLSMTMVLVSSLHFRDPFLRDSGMGTEIRSAPRWRSMEAALQSTVDNSAVLVLSPEFLFTLHANRPSFRGQNHRRIATALKTCRRPRKTSYGLQTLMTRMGMASTRWNRMIRQP